MSKSISRDELKKELIDLLLKDKEVRTYLVGVLVESFATKEDIKSILEEIKSLREDFNKRMEEMRVDFNKRMGEMRADFNKRMETFERRMEEMRIDFNKRMEVFERRMEEMRIDFNKRMEVFDIKLSALGARWGIYSEESFRRALRGLLEEHFKAKVSRWEKFDEDGLVYGYPSMIDVDVLIRDGRHILIEIKSHVRKSDVAELLRIGELYEREAGYKPELMIVTPFIDDKAKEFAESRGIKVYSTDELR